MNLQNYAKEKVRHSSVRINDIGVLLKPNLEATFRGMAVYSKRVNIDQDDCSMSTFTIKADMLKTEISLHQAARNNDTNTLNMLIEKVKKLDLNARNNLDRTPLQIAATNGSSDVLDILLSAGANIELQDKYGMRPLLWAAWFGHLPALEMLDKAGARIGHSNKQGMTALHCAAQNNHKEIIKYLKAALDKRQILINAMNQDEMTSINLAAANGGLETVQYLIDWGCDICLQDKDGLTPLHAASKNGHARVVRALLEAEADLEDRTDEDMSALHLAAESGHLATVTELVNGGANVNLQNSRQLTPMAMASSNGHTLVVEYLLSMNALDTRNYQGNTSLHLAAHGNHTETVRILLSHGCNKNLQNERMQTALHIGVQNGLTNVVEELLKAGADLNIRDKIGKTPLYLAKSASFITIVDMLIRADRYEAKKHGFYTMEKDGPSRPGSRLIPNIVVTSSHTELKKLDEKSPLGKDSDGDSAVSSTVGDHPDIDDADLELSSEPVSFKRVAHPYLPVVKDVLWQIANKQLQLNEWKRLCHYWHFSDTHIKAIEHQYTGSNSYKEHGFRSFMIWMHGIPHAEHPLRQLHESLCAIGRKRLAESIRRKINSRSIHGQKDSNKSCVIA